jgi:hypothetical protein
MAKEEKVPKMGGISRDFQGKTGETGKRPAAASPPLQSVRGRGVVLTVGPTDKQKKKKNNDDVVTLDSSGRILLPHPHHVCLLPA